jgi:hypothetical protein
MAMEIHDTESLRDDFHDAVARCGVKHVTRDGSHPSINGRDDLDGADRFSDDCPMDPKMQRDCRYR